MKENKTISFTIRMKPSVFKILVNMAQLNGISVNEQIRRYLEQGLKTEKDDRE